MTQQPLLGAAPAPGAKVYSSGGMVPMGSPYGAAPAPPLAASDMCASEVAIANAQNIHIKRVLEGCIRLKLYYEAFIGKDSRGQPFMRVDSVKEICSLCAWIPMLCDLWHNGNNEWPMRIISQPKGDQEGMATITESGMPVMIQGPTEFKGRMRSSWWGCFCLPCGCGHEVLGKTEGEIYSSLGPCFEACCEKLCFCCKCENGYIKALREIYKYKPPGGTGFGPYAFKVYRKIPICLFFCPIWTICLYGCCRQVEEFEVEKVGQEFPESPFLLVAPVVGNSVH